MKGEYIFGLKSVGMITDWETDSMIKDKAPITHWLPSRYLGLEIMTFGMAYAAEQKRKHQLLFRFDKRKQDWVQVVGYKRMRRVCRILKNKK